MMRPRRLRLTLFGAALCIGAAAYAQHVRSKLIVNGTVASTAVREIDGRAYVPVADVAHALGLQLVARTDAYELTKAGGANQVEGQNGKIGDVLFNGKWRFQVVSIAPADSYTMQYKCGNDYGVYHETVEFDSSGGVVTPKAGNTLYVVKCVLKNGLPANQALWRYNPDTHTALTDDQGQSYPPVIYDHAGTSSFGSKDILPGAALPLTVLFTTPTGTKPKDLVFTLRTLSDKGSDVRVSLAPPSR